jgi:protein-tyrosine phosphatase
MFTDIHTHILPGVDDGCKNLSESLELIKSELENDVKKIVLTPHFNCDGDNFLNRETFLAKIKELKSCVKKNNIEIDIFPGMEIKASFKILDFLNNKDYLLTLSGKKKYILIELPFTHLPYDLIELLFKIKLYGLIPILAHPERNDVIRKELNFLRKIRDDGLLIQVNNSSLIKRSHPESYKCAVKMLKMGIVDVVASDCHYMEGRFSNFKIAYDVLKKVAGRDGANKIAIENPDKILQNEDIL